MKMSNKKGNRDKRPNIVLIFTDDVGFGDHGCYGATKVQTPNIDRLAEEGRRFTDAHSGSAVCTPSRYSLLTGEYPFRGGISRPIFSHDPLIIDPEKTTLASVLKNAGYDTACIGKWHLGFGDEQDPDWNKDLKPGPLELGFDYYFGIPVVNSHSPFVFVENHRVLGLDPDDPLVYGGEPPTREYPEKILTHASLSGGQAAHALYRDEELGMTLTEKANRWMRQERERPFFLYFATPHVHHPFTPHPRFQGTSRCGRYGDFIHELDWIVGEAMETLDELGLRENTIVILTSDNGGMLNLGGQEAWTAGHRMNGDLLGFKFDAWEGGHRVPFIARWPEKIEPGSVSHQLICHVDLLATLASASGGALSPDDAPDSFNILPALTGSPEKPIRDHIVLDPLDEEKLGFRKDSWVYLGWRGGGGFAASSGRKLGGPAALEFTGQKHSDIENGDFKPEAPSEQLYDLDADPSQSVNVIREHPEVAERLVAELAARTEACRTAPASVLRDKPDRPRKIEL